MAGFVHSSATGDRRPSVLIALGSNLGDRLNILDRAVQALASVVDVDRVSSVWESPPWGGVPQGNYLNAVVRGQTDLSPHKLLARLLEMERGEGRVRTERNGPRTLDLDLLFHGRTVLREDGLTLPHPRWRERPFVVLPLLEVAPDLVDPVSGKTLSTLFPTGFPDGGAEQRPDLALPTTLRTRREAV